MKKIFYLSVLLYPLLLLQSGCVTMKQFDELQMDLDQIAEENRRLTLLNQDGEIERRELTGTVEVLEKTNSELISDTTRLNRALFEAQEEVNRLENLNDVLTSESSSRMAAINDENRALLEELSRNRAALQVQEDDLHQLNSDLQTREAELANRSARIEELEGLLSARDAAAQALQTQLSEALLGFADKGLTVEQRNGKVYVSLEAQLLFPSGSTAINSDGEKALQDLAQVVSNQENLEIIVEGHTDSDQLRSSIIPRNNWELSVLRSTAVVEILTAAGVQPEALSASGRSEFHPIDANDKAKNRRIEIVLAPNLDALFDLIRSN
ncbi:MAG: OmpA family protein [Bacteroidetes bacterium]|nr:OmpA family protein [Bacteroidota bacterium]